MTRRRPFHGLLAILGTAALLVPSCGRGGPKLYPVRGKVLYLGKVPEGATVILIPLGGGDANSPKPSGAVADGGAFTLSTHPYGLGAPAGDYVVVITWYEADARSLENPPNKLPARYGDAATTPLKATIRQGPTDLEPFHLTQ